MQVSNVQGSRQTSRSFRTPKASLGSVQPSQGTTRNKTSALKTFAPSTQIPYMISAQKLNGANPTVMVLADLSESDNQPATSFDLVKIQRTPLDDVDTNKQQ